MKIGDYVIVTNSRGSLSGTVVAINDDQVRVVCHCCTRPDWHPMNTINKGPGKINAEVYQDNQADPVG